MFILAHFNLAFTALVDIKRETRALVFRTPHDIHSIPTNKCKRFGLINENESNCHTEQLAVSLPPVR